MRPYTNKARTCHTLKTKHVGSSEGMTHNFVVDRLFGTVVGSGGFAANTVERGTGIPSGGHLVIFVAQQLRYAIVQALGIRSVSRWLHLVVNVHHGSRSESAQISLRSAI